MMATIVATLAVAVTWTFGQDMGTADGAIRFVPPVHMAKSFVPDFLRRDVQLLKEHFELDEPQQAIVDALYAEYEDAFQKGAQAVRESIDDMQPTEEQRLEMRMHNHTAIKRRLEELVDQMRELQETGIDESPERFEQLKDEAKQLQQRMREGDAAAMEMDLLRQIMKDVDGAVAEWESDKAQLYAAFINDVKVVLSDEQKELWPAFDRKLRRVKTLHEGVLSGESTDVLALVKQLDLTPEQRAPIAAKLEEFEVQLDRALQNRNDHKASTRFERAEIMHSGDVPAAKALIATEVASRIAIRDVNETNARQIAEMLGDAHGVELWNSFRRDAYASALRPSRAGRALDTIEQISDLDDAMREALAAIRAEYEAELAAAREQLIGHMRDYEPEQYRRRFVLQVERVAGEEQIIADDNPLLRSLASIRELDQRYIERALGLLREDQITELPAFVRMGTSWSEHATPTGESAIRGPRTQEQRQEFAKQFDTNGDGKLDAVERDLLRRALQELYKKEAEAQPEK